MSIWGQLGEALSLPAYLQLFQIEIPVSKVVELLVTLLIKAFSFPYSCLCYVNQQSKHTDSGKSKKIFVYK